MKAALLGLLVCFLLIPARAQAGLYDDDAKSRHQR